MKIFRHGDLLIKQIDKLPKNARRLKTNILAEGEVTGHSHRLINPTVQKALSIFEDAQKKYVEVKSGFVDLVHEEHDKITLPDGIYIIEHEQEEDPYVDKIRQVVD